jgi:hypothetical protein
VLDDASRGFLAAEGILCRNSIASMRAAHSRKNARLVTECMGTLGKEIL